MYALDQVLQHDLYLGSYPRCGSISYRTSHELRLINLYALTNSSANEQSALPFCAKGLVPRLIG